LENSFLFKGNWLCIPKCGFRELLIQELHGGALAGHFGVEKTCSMLKEHYFWPKMSRDVEHSSKDAPLGNLPRITFGIKASTPPCRFLKGLRRMLA